MRVWELLDSINCVVKFGFEGQENSLYVSVLTL